MNQFEVIEYKLWLRDDGAKASLYGACPWSSQAEKARWRVVSAGWTVRNPVTGEVGACRPPFATKALAEEFAAKHAAPTYSYGD